MDYKVGDRVRIVNYLNENMSTEMLRDFGGTVVTISNLIYYSDNRFAYYQLKEDRFGWSWTSDMFEGVEYNYFPIWKNPTLPDI